MPATIVALSDYQMHKPRSAARIQADHLSQIGYRVDQIIELLPDMVPDDRALTLGALYDGLSREIALLKAR